MLCDTFTFLYKRKAFVFVSTCDLQLLCLCQILGRKDQVLLHFSLFCQARNFVSKSRGWESGDQGPAEGQVLCSEWSKARLWGSRPLGMATSIFWSMYTIVIHFSVSFRWPEPASIRRQSSEGHCPFQVPTSKSWRRIPWKSLFSEARGLSFLATWPELKWCSHIQVKCLRKHEAEVNLNLSGVRP